MGYLFIALALIAGVTKGYCGKKTSGIVKVSRDAVFLNTVRMLICIIFGFLFCLILGNKISDFSISNKTLLISLVSGIANAFFVVLWLLLTKSNAYMLVEVFLTMSVFVPTILCRFIYNESIVVFQWIGLVLLVVASFLMCLYNLSLKKSFSIKSLLLLILCGASNGFASFSQKWFTKSIENGVVAVFNFYSYIFSFIVLLIYFIFYQIISNKYNEEKGFTFVKKFNVSSYLYIFIMAVCLFLHSFFSTSATNYLDAVQIYPIMQGGSLVLSLLMSRIVFKEKINKYCILGIILAFVALIFINVFPSVF
ncbi:MAG: EamA family transporter [Clostridia bacterium]|nr:EamA family transporter [Clostridia bacterium]